MIPLSTGDLCPRCRRLVPEQGESRPISTPLTEPIDVRALELFRLHGVETKARETIRKALAAEFHADEYLLFRTTTRVEHWLTHEAHEEWAKERFA